VTFRLTLLLAFVVPLAACSSTHTSVSKRNQTASAQLTDPNGGFGDETAAQRRAEWLQRSPQSPGG